MFTEKRDLLHQNYIKAREYFIQRHQELIDIEYYIAAIVNNIIQDNYQELENDYNEASYLHPFWANYPPDDRGRAPIGDQIPWIEVGEHSIGHKLCRLIAQEYKISEVGLPSGADNRFVLYSEKISEITNGFTDCAFVFLDIKSVGPRDNFAHTVISPYQVSGDGIWDNVEDNLHNSIMSATGKQVSHIFHPAISPIYSLTTGRIAPTVHLFVKPIYRMLNTSSDGKRGQPLQEIKSICVPNGLLLSKNPNYLATYPGLFFPGKDDKGKDPRKIRVRVSFKILEELSAWRVVEFALSSN